MKRRSAIPYFAALLILGMMLGGCANTPAPGPVFYRFDAPAAPAESGRHFNGKLRIEPLRAQGILSERALLFSRATSPIKVEQYRYHLWTKPPAHLISEGLQDYLQQAGVAEQIISSDLRADAALSIDGELLRLERVINNRQESVSMEVLLRLRHYRSRDVLLQQRYAETQNMDDGSITAAVQALSLARQRIYARFLEDLKSLPRD